MLSEKLEGSLDNKAIGFYLNSNAAHIEYVIDCGFSP